MTGDLHHKPLPDFVATLTRGTAYKRELNARPSAEVVVMHWCKRKKQLHSVR
jgi:hypothetical protein